jgi:opacity protein-like surface antigen
MNTIKLSAVVLLLTSTFGLAGGDFAAVEPVIEIPEITEEAEQTGFYAGLGYSCLQMGLDTSDLLDVRAMTAVSFTAGYNINQYLALEGRYTVSLGDLSVETWNADIDESWDMSNIALYLKPQYTMDKFTVYGLLGYGQITFDNGISYSETSIQYGAGISAMATDNIDVYLDYRRLYDDTDLDGFVPERDVSANSFTLGANYHF